MELIASILITLTAIFAPVATEAPAATEAPSVSTGFQTYYESSEEDVAFELLEADMERYIGAEKLANGFRIEYLGESNVAVEGATNILTDKGFYVFLITSP